MFRLFFLVFHGSYRGSAHPHESSATMTIPLVILAVLSVVGGALNVPHLLGGHEAMKHYLATAAPALGASSLQLSAVVEWSLMGITTALVLATMVLAFRRFAIAPELDGDSASMPMPKRLLAERWRIDELYAWAFERPFDWLSTQLHASGEQRLMNPIMVGFGAITLRLGGLVRRIQTGNASFHLLAMLAGMIIFLIITLLSN
jgi:NADH-quinone oxidoreductase subunit L